MGIRAWAAPRAAASMEAFDYDPGTLGDEEVEVAVEHCGLCHSDLSMIDDELRRSRYPLVPGHEAAKLMTAWLVAELASRKPEVLNETLMMSVRADETRGSTADLRSGEQVTIHDALYGLMLPSGNDMSVALAEHFGNRVRGMKRPRPQLLPLMIRSSSSSP